MNLFIDYETASACDITQAGGHEYARHDSTFVLCMAFAFDGEDPRVYVPSNEITRAMMTPEDFAYPVITELPKEVVDHIKSGGHVVAHNAQFDWAVWAHQMPDSAPKIEQMICTSAMACAMALPASLDALTQVLKTPHKKNAMGTRLINKMCKPPFLTSRDLLGDMVNYCAEDVKAMMSAYPLLMPLTQEEQDVWVLNAKINERGLPIDTHLASECIRLASEVDTELANMAGMTLTGMRSPKQMKERCEQLGQTIESFSKTALASTNILNKDVETLIEIREQVCKSSIKKFSAMLEASKTDGRARGNHVYHRATTGRFAGSGVQIQNLPRPNLKNADEVAEHVLQHGALPSGFDTLHKKGAISSLLRSCIHTPDEFYCADFSAIEVRVIFWLANEQKGLDLYRKGEDIYCATASEVFGYPCNKKQHPRERQIGKALVLGANYGLGAQGFARNCEGQGVDLLGKDPKVLVDGYRGTFANVPTFWQSCEKAAIAAIRNPDRTATAGKYLQFRFSKKWGALGCILPSGRLIQWPRARIEKGETPWGQVKDQIHYEGIQATTKQWCTKTTHGADIAQSATQGVARDMLCETMRIMDSKGFNIVLHVHDEIMVESFKAFNRFDEFMGLMDIVPQWAENFPIASEGWRGQRYQK